MTESLSYGKKKISTRPPKGFVLLTMRTPKSPKPPEWLERLLESCTPIEYRDGVLGDLSQEYMVELERIGASRANVWYVRQVLNSLLPLFRQALSNLSILGVTKLFKRALGLRLPPELRDGGTEGYPTTLREHLHSEILRGTQALEAQRSKVAYSVLMGPMLVLPAVALSGVATSLTWAHLWLIPSCVALFGLAYCSAHMDRTIFDHLQSMREAIGWLDSEGGNKLPPHIHKKMEEPSQRDHRKIYCIGMLSLLLLFGGMVGFFLTSGFAPPIAIR